MLLIAEVIAGAMAKAAHGATVRGTRLCTGVPESKDHPRAAGLSGGSCAARDEAGSSSAASLRAQGRIPRGDVGCPSG